MRTFSLPTTVARVYTVWFRGGERRQRFELAVSDDGQSWQTIFDGTSSGNTTGPEPCPAKPFTARYVRLTGHGNTINRWNSLGEIIFLAEQVACAENARTTGASPTRRL